MSGPQGGVTARGETFNRLQDRGEHTPDFQDGCLDVENGCAAPSS